MESREFNLTGCTMRPGQLPFPGPQPVQFWGNPVPIAQVAHICPGGFLCLQLSLEIINKASLGQEAGKERRAYDLVAWPSQREVRDCPTDSQ